jgi:hypothetical protein
VTFEGLANDEAHRAAFDSDLIGIDPDYRIHVSDRLLDGAVFSDSV